MSRARVEGRRIADGLAGRQHEVHAVGRPEVRADDAREVPGTRLASDDIAQDQTRFLCHGATVVGRTHAQASLDIVVKVANRDARHPPTPSGCARRVAQTTIAVQSGRDVSGSAERCMAAATSRGAALACAGPSRAGARGSPHASARVVGPEHHRDRPLHDGPGCAGGPAEPSPAWRAKCGRGFWRTSAPVTFETRRRTVGGGRPVGACFELRQPGPRGASVSSGEPQSLGSRPLRPDPRNPGCRRRTSPRIHFAGCP